MSFWNRRVAPVAATPAERLLALGLFDPRFHRLTSGVVLQDPAQAARHFVEHGMPAGRSCHPLLDVTTLPPEVREAWSRCNLDAVLTHLRRPAADIGSLGRWFDASHLSSREGEWAAHPGGVLGWFLSDAQEDSPLPGAEPLTWGQLCAGERLLAQEPVTRPTEAAVLPRPDWPGWAQADLAGRVASRVSVCIVTQMPHDVAVRAVQSVVDTTAGRDVEVVVVDNGSGPDVALWLAAHVAGVERVVHHRLAQSIDHAMALTIAVLLSTGENVMLLNHNSQMRPGWLDALVARLDEPGVLGVQPLLQAHDDSIRSAGQVFVAAGMLPSPFLAGLPPEDAGRARSLRFEAIAEDGMLVRAADLLRLRGLTEGLEGGLAGLDWCLRAAQELGGHFVVEPTARVRIWEPRQARQAELASRRGTFLTAWHDGLPAPSTRHHEALGLEVTGLAGDGHMLPVPSVQVRRRPGQRRRWGIRQPAVGGLQGDRWGDTPFTDSLAAALTALGEEAVTYRHGANLVPSGLDDVTLVIRGRDRVPPVPGTVNILWIISHPATVTQEELLGFDHVFAASRSWAEAATASSGRRVEHFPQATDSRIFAPAPPRSPRTRPIVFVGSTHPGRRRPIVSAALAAGADLRVIGLGWAGLLPPGVWEAEYVDNQDLPAVYRSARVVLADHWPDMAALGFVQNRIFDALACGTPVICDEVAGLPDSFADVVRSCSGVDDFTEAHDALTGRGAPTAERLAQVARLVTEQHSFAARAAQLVGVLDS